MGDRGWRLVRALVVSTAVALAVGALWLAFDNPVIHHTGRGAVYTCLAPWDTVLNHADNFPGGEPPPDGEDIAARCRAAGEHRFVLALLAGTGAAAMVVAAVAVGSGDRRRTSRPTPDGR
jgi:hypothetical protein